MSVNEILEEMEHLSPGELKVIQGKLEALQGETEETAEMLAAIEEGIRSADAEPMIPLADAIKEIGTWNTESP